MKKNTKKNTTKNTTGYYNENTLEKFRAEFWKYADMLTAGAELHVRFPLKNSKMGPVPSVSLLPFLTCPGRCKDTCGAICYAAKFANMYANVREPYAINTALAMYRPEQYWSEIRDFMRGQRFFRFHVSGDILNAEYFAEMIRAAMENPHCEALAFTKKWEVVNEWIANNGDLPENLHILFSGWEDMEPENPHDLPETNVYGNEGPREGWLLCGGNCYECGCRGLGCWQARKGDIVAFKKH